MAKAKETPAQETTEKTAAKKATGPSVVKKLSIATVYGKVLLAKIPQDGELKICRLAGIAVGTDSGSSAYGDWICLVGQCAATNYETGEIFVGKSVFVPGAMGEALVDALITAQKEDAAATLKFSMDISVKVSPRDANKYEYIVRPVMESDVKNEAMLLLSL
jgi:hypothetical protein